MGLYNFNGVGVYDVADFLYKSYLAVDNIRICQAMPSLGDINRDCKVDLEDFSILAIAWLADCESVTDPDSPLYDPDIPCHQADTDGSNFVDANDLTPVTNHWLETFWSE